MVPTEMSKMIFFSSYVILFFACKWQASVFLRCLKWDFACVERNERYVAVLVVGNLLPLSLLAPFWDVRGVFSSIDGTWYVCFFSSSFILLCLRTKGRQMVLTEMNKTIFPFFQVLYFFFSACVWQASVLLLYVKRGLSGADRNEQNDMYFSKSSLILFCKRTTSLSDVSFHEERFG